MTFTKQEYQLTFFWITIGFPAWMLLYYSMHVLPVGLAETIQNFTPFMTLMIGFFYLKESLKKLEVLNMFVSFGGVLFIILFSSKLAQASSDVSTIAYLLGILANAVSAGIFAVNNVIIRRLKHLNTVALAALHATTSLVISTVILLAYRLLINSNGFSYNFDTTQIVLMLGNGVVITVATQCYIKAFQLDKAGRASSLWFLAIVVGYAMDIAFFSYQLEWHEVIGSMIIVGCSLMVFVLKLRSNTD